VEDADLVKDGGAVIVDFFSGETVVIVEGVDAAERELDAAAGGWKSAPRAEMRAADDDFDQDGVVGDVAALHVDLEIGKRSHQLLVKGTDAGETEMMFLPGLVVVTGGIAKGAEDGCEVVVVLVTDVLLDERDASQGSVFWNGCGSHIFPRLRIIERFVLFQQQVPHRCFAPIRNDRSYSGGTEELEVHFCYGSTWLMGGKV
jgi:hypothetical protein